MPLYSHQLTSILMTSFFFLKATASQPCYWPNGTQTDSNSVACSSTGTSQCCQIGSSCLNNGLCFNPGDGIPYRGACTSQGWVATNTSSCPTFCSNWNGGYGWAELNFCGQLGGTQRYWCDDPETSPNRCAGLMYAWPEALGGVAANVGPALEVTTGTVSPTVSPTTTSTPTSSGTPSGTTTQSTSSLPAMNDSKLPLAIGAGVGIPLGILVLGVLAFIFMKARTNKKRGTRIDDIALRPGWTSSEIKPNIWVQPHEVAAEQEVAGNSVSELPEHRYHDGRDNF
ncbi:uncharacterized protein PAC_11256 [Phialocephala subalpina]|uniref:Mid2 domain-containing protein n=1 Tax=Phialocephala subalpina TaxID=576137 RepID=A0A1L7X8L7_9HELO|nr:uncharacterized protein PAC_11256 [Phialocephala subalpina]